MSNTPLWVATHHAPEFPPLRASTEVDVAVVGAGISGLTAAILLSRSGLRVAVLERDRVGSGETGHTTSHLTEAVDGRYQTIIKDFGEEAGRLVAQSGRDAIDRIESLVRELGIDCGFDRVPGYLYTEKQEDVEGLANELDAARRAGCQVAWVDEVPLPFQARGGVRWDRQAQLHPMSYLAGLAQEAARSGVQIVERTKVTGVYEDEPCRIETDRFEVRAKDVFVAANVPVNNRVLLHTKVAAYRSYAIAGEVEPKYLHGLFWDTADPYHYIRVHQVDGRWYVIVGGEDHRTGDVTETDECFDRLTAYAHERLRFDEVAFRWSGQIIEPVDGLPYIGRNAGSTHVYVATGYSGNGMTFGTLAGMIVVDLIKGSSNAYAELFDATRVTPRASMYDYVAENVAFPLHLVKDRLTNTNADVESLDDLQPGEGGIFASDEGKLAVYRDDRGGLHALSPVCTHLACDVAWNAAEKTWDCPCHGSRFSPEGKVINGPAVSDLTPRPVPELK